MDFSKMSDAELDQMVAQKQMSQGIDFAKLSDAEVDQMVQAKAAQTQQPRVIDEMHPKLALSDRAVVKNFSTDPEVSVNFLKKKYPGMEIEDRGGRLVMRAPGEQDFRVLDPDTGIDLSSMQGVKELGADTLDLGSDIVNSIGSSAATAAGGVAGGIATGGVGAIPGAIAAGASSSAALEAAKQKLGELFGLENNMNKLDVGIAGVTGGLSPVLFGSGAGAKQVGKALAQKGIKGATAQKMVTAGQEGILSRGYDVAKGKVAPWLGEKISGVSSGTIKAAANKMDVVEALEKDGVTDFATVAHEKISDTLFNAKQEVGEKLGAALDAANQKVDLSGAKAQFEELLGQLRSQQKRINNPMLQQRIDEVQGHFDEIFGANLGPPKSAGGYHVPGQDANPGMFDFSSGKRVGKVADVPDATVQIVDNPRLRTNPITGMQEEVPSQIPNMVSARDAFTLQDGLRDIAELSKIGKSNSLTGRLFNKSTTFEKQVAQRAQKAYGALNDELEKVAGTAGLKSEYKRLIDIQRDLAPHFKDPNQTFNTLRNLGAKNKTLLREKLGKFDREFGTDLMDTAETLDVFNTFSKASPDAISTGGSTSTSRTVPLAIAGGSIGTLVGYQQGGGYAGAAVGGGVGGVLGSKLGSPQAIRAMITGGKKLERTANAVGSKLNPNQLAPGVGRVYPQAWINMMQNKGESKR